MKNIIQLLILLFSIVSINLSANPSKNLPPRSVTLCSGQTFTWEEYLEYKACMEDEWDEEIEFVSYETAAINNTLGAWSSIINMPIIPVAAANLPNGKLMTWSARDRFSFGGSQGRTYTAIFDPVTNTATEALISNTGHDMFCPGVSTLPDGRVMVTGGSNSNKSSIYDPISNQWTTGGDLNIARGYHSGVTLSSGAAFVIGGSWSGGQFNKDAELWSEKSGWYKVPGLPAEIISDNITSTQAASNDDYFPWLWAAPNGKLFHAGPSQDMHWIDPSGVGTFTDAGTRGDDDFSASGTTVMYDIGKILKAGGAPRFGGNEPANNKAYTIDINNNNPVVTQVGNLSSPRAEHNSIVLPSGEVVVIGGLPTSQFFSDQNAILYPEIWNPTTGNWTTMASMQVPRNYHSVGLLLPDGRIFAGGGGLCGTCAANHPDAEIFSPPYLFDSNGTLATRPVINNAPSTTDYNTTISVQTNENINTFALVKTTGVTHSTSNDQRRIPLNFTNNGNNNYTLSIPNRNILPPGSYMLFAMNNNGVPSVSKFIQIGENVHSSVVTNNPSLGGTGLQATYFNSTDLTNLAFQQIDPTIDFDWGTGNPTGLAQDFFSVRWEGTIQVPTSGGYTFYTNSDDGIRLWVNNRQIVDNWTVHAATEDIGEIVLEAGISYDIRIEYFENTGDAVSQLSWSGPGINKSIIESQYLFPPNPCSNLGGDTDGDGICDENDDTNGNCSLGAACNDNDNCTINDAFDNNCNCVGTFQDADNDGICDANDNTNGNCSLGATCNDNDPCTINDVFDNNCNCAGTFQDADNDGICDANDNTNGNCSLGATCNDNDPCTINDVFDNNCNCAGTFQDSDNDGICDANEMIDCMSGQYPYNCEVKNIPGLIELEEYDEGGQGLAYNDNNTKNGDQSYRPNDNVDVSSTYVGWIQGGEWLEYTVDAVAGIYTLELPVSSNSSNPGDVQVSLNGVILTTFDIQNTGSWNNYDILTVGGINIQEGMNQILRLDFIGGSFNLDYLNFVEEAAPEDYCISQGGNTTYEFIQKVEFGGINNDSGDDDGYGDYTSIIEAVEPGASIPIILTPGFSGNVYNEVFKVWIDYNRDGVFDPNTEEAFEGIGNATPASGLVNIPNNASNGLTRMRVSMRWNSAPNSPCSNITYGEVEDYTLFMGELTCTPNSACDDGDLCTINDQLDASCACVGTLQDADNDGVCDEEDPCPNDPNDGCLVIDYCTVSGGNTTYEFIQKVEFAGINNDSGNNSGFSDFTNLSATVTAGQTVPITLTPGFSGNIYNEMFRVWIDFNRNGSFDDAGEQVFTGMGNATPAQGTIAIPSNAVAGTTRMRVSMRWNTVPSSPCTNVTYGEIEDYSVIISNTANLGMIAFQAPIEQLTNELVTEMTVSPNPTVADLNITWNQPITVGDLYIYSNTGQQMLRQTIKTPTQQQTIDVRDFSEGMYIVRLEQTDGTYLVQRFIKVE